MRLLTRALPKNELLTLQMMGFSTRAMLSNIAQGVLDLSYDTAIEHGEMLKIENFKIPSGTQESSNRYAVESSKHPLNLVRLSL
jgi:hypothetical protein